MDLNQLYRRLLESGRHQPRGPAGRPSAVRERAAALRAAGLTYEQVAEQLRDEFAGRGGDHQERRRGTSASDAPSLARTTRPPGWRHERSATSTRSSTPRCGTRCDGTASSATSPTPPLPRRPLRLVRIGRRHGRPSSFGPFSTSPPRARYLPAWIFLATSGCRRGECLGLRWCDIDLDEGTAIVSRQVTALDHQVIVKEFPKTKQAHLIRLDSGTVVTAPAAACPAGRSKAAARPGLPGRWLRVLPVRRPAPPPGAVLTRVRPQAALLQPGPSRHPLPTITLHGLRHTWATLALSAGIDIKIVSERLNHSSTHITREIYTHVTPPMQSDAAERVAKLIHGS